MSTARLEPHRSIVRPSLVFVGLALIAVAAIVAAVRLSLDQRRLPFALRASGETVEALLPAGAATLRGIAASPEGPWLEIVPDDLVEDSDSLPSYAAAAEFRRRQSALRAVLQNERLSLRVERDGGEVDVLTFDTRPRRVGDLPGTFFPVLVTGVAGFLLAGWVWALRQRERSAIALACSGVGLLLTLVTFDVVVSREVALDGSTVALLGRLNHAGAALFGAAIVALFACYPTPLLSRRTLTGVMLLAALWALLDAFEVMPNALVGCYLPVLIETVVIFALLAVQAVRSWRLPRERASLGWMGLSVALGIGAYMLLEPLPMLLGDATPSTQSFAPLTFLVVYVGIALGVLRYRLFDLGTWAFRGLFYVVGLLLLLLGDALLVVVLHLARAPSLGIALLVVGSVYLPARNVLLARVSGRRDQIDPKLIEEALAVAFEPRAGARAERWKELLARRFDALEVLDVKADERELDAPRIEEDGLALAVPGLPSLGAVRVRYARRGRGLFRDGDRQLVSQLLLLLAKVQSGREAYDRGVVNERKRMAQDLHDDIGARLVSSLYVADDKTRPLLEAALADMRFVVSGLAGDRVPLGRLLADLRRECVDRCKDAAVALDWPLPSDSDVEVEYETVRAIRSVTREAFTNVFRHAKASRVEVRVSTTDERDEGAVTMSIEDDGIGIPAELAREPGEGGHGLPGMKARVERARGTCRVESRPGRTRIELTVPLVR